MPYSEPDPSDPHTLVGVGVPAGQEVHLDMAYVIAEEFTRLGFDEDRQIDLLQRGSVTVVRGPWRYGKTTRRTPSGIVSRYIAIAPKPWQPTMTGGRC